MSVRVAVAAALCVVLTDSIARVEVVTAGSITLLVLVANLVSPALVPTGEMAVWALSVAG